MTKVQNLPKISIITACFNSRDFLEKTFQSVASQNYVNIEYIVIDGASTDGSLEVINKYSNLGIISKFISEPDFGIADAWNKGIKLSSGTVIGFLNANDEYSSTSVQDFVNYYIENSYHPGVYYGNTHIVNDKGLIEYTVSKLFRLDKISSGFGFIHTSTFTSKTVFDKVGTFDISIKIAIDTDFLLRCLNSDVQFFKSPIISFMATGGVSDTNRLTAQIEYHRALNRHGFKNKYNFLPLIKFLAFLFLRSLFGKYFISKIKLQTFFILLFLFNKIQNLLFINAFRRNFLLLFGIKIGINSFIHSNVKLFNFNNLEIGSNTTINNNCYIDNRMPITIGNNVSIAHNCKLYTLGHDVNDPGFAIKGSSIVIDDYACIFSNVIILPGVTIGKGAVVYPGSVVTKSIQPFEIHGGNPAKYIRMRNQSQRYNLDYGYWFSL